MDEKEIDAEILGKYFKETENKAIPPGKNVPEVKSAVNLERVALEFWSVTDPDNIMNYRKGLVMSITSKPCLRDFLDRLPTAFNESIRNELQKNNITSENLKVTFDMISLMFKLLSQNINVGQVDGKSVVASLQGFINGYVAQTYKKEPTNEG